MPTDFSIQLYSGGLDVLCDIIIGYDTHPDDGGSNLPYRKYNDIENFFTDIGISVVEKESRAKTARATLSSINSTPLLKPCIESALLPAHFLRMDVPGEAYEALLPHLEAVGWSLRATKRNVSVVPDDNSDEPTHVSLTEGNKAERIFPTQIDDLLRRIIKGLPRAMHPLSQRRKGLQPLMFSNEYDVQDLLHSLLRPWVLDIRPEEFTPSFAGSSTRMDFLLPKHSIVIEVKIVRDKAHSKKIGEELILDIAHYRVHPNCKYLWCVIYDPNLLLPNAEGLRNDLAGQSKDEAGQVTVIVEIV